MLTGVGIGMAGTVLDLIIISICLLNKVLDDFAVLLQIISYIKICVEN